MVAPANNPDLDLLVSKSGVDGLIRPARTGRAWLRRQTTCV